VVDWSTVASLATAGGTLVLAIATFSSVRSANRAARAAERSLLAGLRPVLVPSRLEDREEKLTWVDLHYTHLRGGRATVELVDGIVYLAISVRNVGTGIAVLQSWRPMVGRIHTEDPRGDIDSFRRQTRDIYVPAGDLSFWQGALREQSEADYAPIAEAIAAREAITIDLLYSDHEGASA